jgi:hypothetical protein
MTHWRAKLHAMCCGNPPALRMPIAFIGAKTQSEDDSRYASAERMEARWRAAILI